MLVEYSPAYGPELVRMWRESFERAVGVTDPHTLEEQLRYLEEKVVRENRVLVVLDAGTDAVVGFMASTPEKVEQLYVHVAHQRRGIGSMLLDIAKRDSRGRLRLFTFLSNANARRFYESRGFREVGRGFEEGWQLEDVEYEWTAA